MHPTSLLVALTWTLTQAPATTHYVIDSKEAKVVHATLHYDVHCPDLKAKEWVAFLARIPQLSRQRDVKMTVDPPGAFIKEIGGSKRDMVRIRLPVTTPAAEKNLHLKVHYEATLQKRTLRPLRPGEKAPAVAPLSKSEHAAYVAETEDYDFTKPAFQKWMKQHNLTRGPAESDIDYARRVFLAIVKNFRYEYSSSMDRHASAVCKSGGSDCGGMAIAFISALRSQNIPARSLFGRWALSSKKGDTLSGVEYHQWHVKAEFYAAGVGWVPVDLSSAVLHDKSPERLRYFGADPGDFLTQHVDPAWKVDTIHFGQHEIRWLQSPVYWVTGAGKLTNTKVHESWTVR